MSVIDVEPSGPATSDTPVGHDHRRRRWPWVVVAVVVAFVAAAGIWLAAYQPLGHGTGGYAVRAGGTESAQVTPPGQDTTHIVVYRTGATAELYFPLWNFGPLPVRVDEIGPVRQGLTCGFQQTAAEIAPGLAGDLDAERRPFAPFRLAPGEFVQVFISGGYTEPCWQGEGPGGYSLTQSAPVRFSVLGALPRSADVPFGYVFATSYDPLDPWLEVDR
jgi:hypothetical protein